MNLLYLHQHFTTPSGSSGTRSYEMAVRMVKQGHSVTVLCGSFGAGKTGLTGVFENGVRKGIVDGIQVIELELPYQNKDGFFKRAMTFVKFALRTILSIHSLPKPDLIYATSTPLTVAIPALWAKWIKGIPFIFEVRDLWPELPQAMGVITNPLILKALKLMERAAYRNAEACVGLSPGMVNGIKKELKVSKEVRLIPNGCDLDLFVTSREVYAKKYSDKSLYDSVPWLDPTKCNFVFAGTMGIANGLENLLEAIKLVPEEIRSRLSVHLIGDGKEKISLQDKVKELEIDNCVFFHEPMPKRELSQAIGMFDAGILTLQNVPEFQYGTSPNKFFDYISAGLPVINNYQGWVAELITEADCGLFSKAGDNQQFAGIISRFSEFDKNQKESMSGNAVRLSRKFDRHLLAQKQIELCEEVVD